MNESYLQVIYGEIEWQEALNEVSHFDFYHTYEYHHLSSLDNEKVVLLKYIEGHKIILFPLLIRKINGNTYFDATSVYGYCGPLQKNIDHSFNNQNFIKTLNDYFRKEKIISVFSRLNPFIEYQESILKNLGEIIPMSNIVNINLTNTLEEQRKQFSKTTKRYINKAEQILDIKVLSNDEWLDTFIQLYYENMDRVKAKEKYYFKKDYFYNLINNKSFKVDSLFVIHKETNKVISAALMVKTNNIIQYHLSGTKKQYLHLSPIRLLINEMRIRGKQEKFEYFNLGGGIGNKTDELFRFKASFSKDFKTFKTWKLIVNEDIYNQLSAKNNINESNYFPLYRQHENEI